jgi:hypothetical protein
MSTAVQIDSRQEVLSDQLVRWFHIDPLSWQVLSECGYEAFHITKGSSLGIAAAAPRVVPVDRERYITRYGVRSRQYLATPFRLGLKANLNVDSLSPAD